MLVAPMVEPTPNFGAYDIAIGYYCVYWASGNGSRFGLMVAAGPKLPQIKLLY